MSPERTWVRTSKNGLSRQGKNTLIITRLTPGILIVMRVALVLVPAALAFAGAGTLLILRSQQSFGIQPSVEGVPRHPVTDPMREDAAAMARKPAADFKIPDLDGKEWTLAEVQQGKPTLVYFILDGCPCSTDAEPLIQSLRKTHEGRVNFVGIIDSPAEKARKWVDGHSTKNLVLISRDAKVMRDYEAPRSVYSTLLDSKGRIIKQWPGYSKRILTEMNEEMAKATGVPTPEFDTAYAPLEDSSGCSFQEGVGY